MRSAIRYLYLCSALCALASCAPHEALPPGPVPRSLGTTPLRRLSNVEYLHSMHDLFPGVSPTDLPVLPPDTIVNGFENDARSLAPTDVAISRYESIAFAYTTLATADDAALANVLPCASWVTPEDQDACGRALVTSFGRRVHRRPLDPADAQQLASRFTAFRTAIDFRAAVQLTLMALVQSPEFLYRIEIPGMDATTSVPGGARVDAYAFATRLSYLLWSSGPDDELLDLAQSGQLLDPTVTAAQVDRMLADPRIVEMMVDFDRQWLDFDRILTDANDTRDPAQYPTWTTTMQASEHEEIERFARWSASEGQGTLAELFTSRHAFVDSSMASVYGVDAPAAGWVEVELPSDQRAGMLTRAAFLAGRSHPGSISPPLRGVYVLERVLCQPHRSPPPNADLSPPTQLPGANATDRMLFEARTASATCSSCHRQINGVGFAFEHYDAIGSFRTLDQGMNIDATGQLIGVDPGLTFNDAVDLSEQLATSDLAASCAVDTWVRYALGRSLETADGNLRRQARAAFDGSEGTLREMLRAIALSSELRLQQAVQE